MLLLFQNLPSLQTQKIQALNILNDQGQKALEIIAIKCQRPVHISFAQGHFRIADQMPDCGAVVQPNLYGLARLVAVSEHVTRWHHDL